MVIINHWLYIVFMFWTNSHAIILYGCVTYKFVCVVGVNSIYNKEGDTLSQAHRT
jgi:hypothetical protein